MEADLPVREMEGGRQYFIIIIILLLLRVCRLAAEHMSSHFAAVA
jgi:hypothetical protein